MTRALTAPQRLLAATLIDWIGTGFYLAISAIFLTRSVGLSAAEVGVVLAVAGFVAFAGSVQLGRLGDRFGPRRVLLALYALRAAAFVGLTLTHQLGVTVAMLSAIALGDQTAPSLYQALAAALVREDERVRLMARMRVVANVGLTLGTVVVAIALAGGGDSFTTLLLANAASYLLAAAIVATFPRDAAAARSATRRRLLIPSPATVAMIGINGLMSMWLVILNVGIPLWIVSATSVPRPLVAILYATNTAVAVCAQGRVARVVRSYERAAHAQRLAGLLLAACCGCLAASTLTGATVSTIVLIAAVLLLSGGELLCVSSAWEVSFTLAPADRSAEFFATYGLGRAASQVGGPILITSVVLALGIPGWLALAGLFLIGAAATPLLARRARARPLVERAAPYSAGRASTSRVISAVSAAYS